MTFVVSIEKLVHGAHGLARLPDGLTLFIPGALPGEEIRAEIVHRKKDFAFARKISIIKPSPHRIEPICNHYPECGGCQLQHVDYRAQTIFKNEMLHDSLKRIIGPDGPLPGPVTASPQIFKYRHRLKFHVKPSTGELCFLKRGSHQFVPIKKCELACTEINSILASLPVHPAWKRISPKVKNIIIGNSPEESAATLLLTISKSNGSMARDLDIILRDLPCIKAVFLKKSKGRLRGPFPPNAPQGGRRMFSLPFSSPGLSERSITVSPGVFVQNNWEVNKIMVKKVMELAGHKGASRVLDLHCGMGNFILPLGAKASEVLGVDSDPLAIRDGKLNAKALDIPATFINMTDYEAATGLLKQAESFDVVLLDPPRGGCRNLLPLLPALAQGRLIYISCDPPTLARDINALISLGFTLESFEAFDMFPHTFHTEVIAVLKSSSI